MEAEETIAEVEEMLYHEYCVAELREILEGLRERKDYAVLGAMLLAKQYSDAVGFPTLEDMEIIRG